MIASTISIFMLHSPCSQGLTPGSSRIAARSQRLGKPFLPREWRGDAVPT